MIATVLVEACLICGIEERKDSEKLEKNMNKMNNL